MDLTIVPVNQSLFCNGYPVIAVGFRNLDRLASMPELPEIAADVAFCIYNDEVVARNIGPNTIMSTQG